MARKLRGIVRIPARHVSIAGMNEAIAAVTQRNCGRRSTGAVSRRTGSSRYGCAAIRHCSRGARKSDAIDAAGPAGAALAR